MKEPSVYREIVSINNKHDWYVLSLINNYFISELEVIDLSWIENRNCFKLKASISIYQYRL